MVDHCSMKMNLHDLVLIAEETFQRIGLNKKEHLETNLQKSNAIDIICRFINILLKYLPEYHRPDKSHSFFQTLELLKQSASKISQLDTDTWNDVLKDAFIENEIGFFASKGDKYAIPRKDFHILADQHRPINPIWPGTWFLLHHLSIKLDIEANIDEQRVDDDFHAICEFMAHFFSCIDCASDFGLMSGIFDQNDNSLPRSEFIKPAAGENYALTLWRFHNTVNAKIHGKFDKFGDQSKFSKRQYPDYLTEHQNEPKESISLLDKENARKWHFWPLTKSYSRETLTNVNQRLVQVYGELSG